MWREVTRAFTRKLEQWNGPRNTVYFTVCSVNHLNRARTLANSLRKADPSATMVVFLGDRASNMLQDIRDVDVIPAADMGIADFEVRARRYSAYEFNASLKPAAFEYCFNKFGSRRAIYLDSDVYVIRNFDLIHRMFNRGASCILTPHITAPIRTGLPFPSDFDILKAGICNTGFIAFANVPEARQFIAWWGDKCRTECIIDLSRGLFMDQRYCDLAWSFIEKCEMIRDPGYNVAYWNLMHRPVSRVGGTLLTGIHPVQFIHFSGIEPDNPYVFSKYQTQFRRGDLNGLEEIYEEYLALLDANDKCSGGRYSEVPYGFGRVEGREN